MDSLNSYCCEQVHYPTTGCSIKLVVVLFYYINKKKRHKLSTRIFNSTNNQMIVTKKKRTKTMLKLGKTLGNYIN